MRIPLYFVREGRIHRDYSIIFWIAVIDMRHFQSPCYFPKFALHYAQEIQRSDKLTILSSIQTPGETKIIWLHKL